MEVITQGTGTSSTIPLITCVTQHETPCNTCWSSTLPQGKKNNRRNTGAYFRRIGEDSVIVIDAGKSFLASALEWFPKYKLKKIAAVVLTHAHADAMNGLDDLRGIPQLSRCVAEMMTLSCNFPVHTLGWTLRAKIQDHIDVYLSRETFDEVKRAFPYLVVKELATGGGDVPEFRYHFFEEAVPFIIDGLYSLTPLAVHHGRSFHTRGLETPPISEFLPVAPTNEVESVQIQPVTPDGRVRLEPVWTPYIAYGFIIQLISEVVPNLPIVTSNGTTLLDATDTLRSNGVWKVGQEGDEQSIVPTSTIVYISDVSSIPEKTWSALEQHLSRSTPQETKSKPTSSLSLPIAFHANGIALTEPDPFPRTTPSPSSETPNHLNSSPVPSTHVHTANQVGPPGTTLLIIDCLHLAPHSSHYGLLQALLTAHRLRPQRTYLVGLGHGLTHAELTLVGEMLERFSSLPAPLLSSASTDSSFKSNQDSGHSEQVPGEGEIIKALEEMELDENWDAPGGGVRKAVTRAAVGILEEYIGTVGRCADGDEGLFVRPAYDGMRVVVRDGEVFDE